MGGKPRPTPDKPHEYWTLRGLPRGGVVTLSLDSVNRQARLVVQDTGIGIERDMLEQIFAPFVQARATPTQPNNGLGVGLAVVRQLVHAHGGRVQAFSEGADCGACFEVRLPLGQPPLVHAPAPAPATVPRGVRVLLADDEIDIAHTLGMLLELEGCEVTLAHDGASAMRLAAERQPEVMVLDLGMPNGGGDVVARWVRKQPWAARVRLIAVTGWGRDEDRARTRAAGFDLHLVKPVDHDRLIAAVKEPR